MVGPLLLVCGFAGGQVADATATDELGLQVRQLVVQLDADSLAARQAAEAKLIALGPSALGHLPPVTRSTSAEVKVRLERIRNALEQKRAEAAAEASTVTLHGSMLLSAALAALEKQTGNRIIDFRQRFGQPRSDPTVAVELDRTPFWRALDRLLDQAALTVYNFAGEQRAVALVARASGERARAARACYCGAFRIEGVAVHSRRDLRNPDNHAMQLTLEASWEPRLSPIVLDLAMGDIQAAGDGGVVIPVDSPRSRLEIPVEAGVGAAEFQVPLELPDRRVEKIASLKGALRALVPGRMETFEFRDLKDAKDVQQRKAGVVVILEAVRKNVALYEIRLRVRFDRPGNALESHRGWIYNNEAYLVDAQGQTIDHAGSEAYRQDATEVGVAYLFDHKDGLDGCKLVYKTPAAIMELPVEWELKDIALP